MFSAKTLHDSTPCLPHPRLFNHPDNNWRGVKNLKSFHYAVILYTPH